MSVLLTIGDVARELGVSAPWVHARIHAGELRAIQGIGRGFRVRREWLDAFLRAREVRATEADAPSTTPRSARPRAGRTPKPFASVGEARAALVLVQRRRA